MSETSLSTKEMNREEWLEHRGRGIGGSDSPVIVLGNDHPFKTPYELWQEKMGQGSYTEETPDMKRGKVLEPIAADIYKAKTGRNVRRVNRILQHPEIPCMLANVDREIVGNDRGPGILEIKCPRGRTFSKIKREGLPAYYYIQLQHYLSVTGRSWGSFAIFSADSWELLWFDVEADRGVIFSLEAEIPHWWENYVVKEQPPQDSTVDIDLPDAGGDVVKTETPDWYFAVREYVEAKALADEAKELVSEKKMTITDLMKQYDADVVEGAGARVYWKQQKGRKSFDWKKFQKDNPDMDLSSYFKVSAPSRPFKLYPIKGGLLDE